MTRRIVLALVAFTAAVIVGAAVPLALNAIAHDRNSFIQSTGEIASTYAATARSRLEAVAKSGSHIGSQGAALLVPVLRQVDQAGDGLMILASRRTSNSAGRPQIREFAVTGIGHMPAGNWTQFAAQVDLQVQRDGGTQQTVTETTGPWLVAAAPVYTSSSQLVGTVILAKPLAPLNRSIAELWAILATVGVVAMVGAALLAFGLARWVSRPLAGLDGAASRLADGDLAIRAVVGSGPPELRRLGTTFNTMAGRLETLVHGNRAVIADVSHQLRTPLAALRLRLDLLADQAAESDPEVAHELAGALDELARLSRLVDGLLAVARAENVVPAPVAVDVAAVARERVAAWHPVADDRGIALVDAADPAVGWIGEGHLEQILDNLIANALDALSADGRVTVTTAVTPAGARVTVSDNGPGMSAEDRERAFLRFVTSSPNGTGLGLAIVHRLATANGGTATLSQTRGGGLTVTLDFPGVPPAGSGPQFSGGVPAAQGAVRS